MVLEIKKRSKKDQKIILFKGVIGIWALLVSVWQGCCSLHCVLKPLHLV